MAAVTHSCDACGSASESLKSCSRCLKVWYCDANCQRRAWKGEHGRPSHKHLCVSLIAGPGGKALEPGAESAYAFAALAEAYAGAPFEAAMRAAGVAGTRVCADGSTSVVMAGSAGEIARLMSMQDSNPGAAFTLANRYAEGKGVARNLPASFACYKKAADAGFAIAEYSVACCYANGDGVSADLRASREWMLKSAGHGYAMAQGCCAVACHRGSRGYPKDSAQALRWAQAAAAQGDKNGECVIKEISAAKRKAGGVA